MFQLDDTFLEEVGLGSLPDEQKKAFLNHLYNELQLRVGTQLSEGLSDAQLEEFEAIIDKKDDAITSWIAQHAPQYQQEESFVRLRTTLVQQAQTQGVALNEIDLRNEYAATKWLEVNRPDYRQVVAQVLAQLKQEVESSKDVILGDDNSGPVAA